MAPSSTGGSIHVSTRSRRHRRGLPSRGVPAPQHRRELRAPHPGDLLAHHPISDQQHGSGPFDTLSRRPGPASTGLAPDDRRPTMSAFTPEFGMRHRRTGHSKTTETTTTQH